MGEDICHSIGCLSEKLSDLNESIDLVSDALFFGEGIRMFTLVSGYRFITKGENTIKNGAKRFLYFHKGWLVQRLGTTEGELCRFGPTSTTELSYVGGIGISLPSVSHISFFRKAIWGSILDNWDIDARSKPKQYATKKSKNKKQQQDDNDDDDGIPLDVYA